MVLVKLVVDMYLGAGPRCAFPLALSLLQVHRGAPRRVRCGDGGCCAWAQRLRPCFGARAPLQAPAGCERLPTSACHAEAAAARLAGSTGARV